MTHIRGCRLRGDRADHTTSISNSHSFFSPDIVPLGVAELPDPAGNLLANFDTDPSQPIVSGGLNHIYVRGIYNDSFTKTYTARLYSSDASLILWPQKLKGRELVSAQAFNEVPIAPNYPGSSFCLSTPFVYNAPSSGNLVSFFAEVYSNALLQSGGHSPAIRYVDQNVTSAESLSLLRQENLTSTSQRNVLIVPTLRREGCMCNDFYAGDAAATFLFTVTCVNVPRGWDVSLAFEEKGSGDKTPWLPPTPVTNNRYFTVSDRQDMAANAAGKTYLCYNSNGIAPLPEWSITLDVAMIHDSRDPRFSRALRTDQHGGWRAVYGDGNHHRLTPLGGARIAAPTVASLARTMLGYTQPIVA